MSIWDDLPFSERDRANYARARMGGRIKRGVAPAVLVVDMNSAFTDSRFPTGDSEAAAPAIAALTGLLAVARRNRQPIVYTTTFSSPHESVRGMWKGAEEQAENPLTDSDEAHEIGGPIAPTPADIVLPKAKPSAFWQTGLSDILAYHRIDTVIVTGMVTSGCVRATVVDAFSHNLRVLVPVECVADRGELPHKVNLFDIHMKYGDVLPTQEVCAYLDECAGGALAARTGATIESVI
jgi:nicotinamidase-related amidase